MSKAKFRLVCDGSHTYAELGGKSIGTGVEGVSFEHVSGKDISVNLKLNMKEFEFMPDGYFDEVSKELCGVCEEPHWNKRLP